MPAKKTFTQELRENVEFAFRNWEELAKEFYPGYADALEDLAEFYMAHDQCRVVGIIDSEPVIMPSIPTSEFLVWKQCNRHPTARQDASAMTDTEAHRHACEVRAVAAMSVAERATFYRGAAVKRCRRALGCYYIGAQVQRCDAGPGCGRLAVLELANKVQALLMRRRQCKTMTSSRESVPARRQSTPSGKA